MLLSVNPQITDCSDLGPNRHLSNSHTPFLFLTYNLRNLRTERDLVIPSLGECFMCAIFTSGGYNSAP
ncbi:hypothetical protein BH20ACI3_BH20ACI3_13290 [soil metagenome]